MTLHYSHELTPRETAGALKWAQPLLLSDSVLVLNGDFFCQFNLKAFWVVHQIRGGRVSLLLTEVSDTSRFGWVQVESDGQINALKEKHEASGPGWINAGIYLLSQEVFTAISADQVTSLEKDILPIWVGRGLYGFRSQGRFLDIGIPESYSRANQFFLQET
jgi:NDP-sugar pyrophosphorylase family protein